MAGIFHSRELDPHPIHDSEIIDEQDVNINNCDYLRVKKRPKYSRNWVGPDSKHDGLWWVYVFMYNDEGDFRVGQTKNLQKRLDTHYDEITDAGGGYGMSAPHVVGVKNRQLALELEKYVNDLIRYTGMYSTENSSVWKNTSVRYKKFERRTRSLTNTLMNFLIRIGIIMSIIGVVNVFIILNQTITEQEIIAFSFAILILDIIIQTLWGIIFRNNWYINFPRIILSILLDWCGEKDLEYLKV